MAYFEVIYSNGYCGCDETHYIEAENEGEAIDIACDEIELYGFYEPDSRFIDRGDYESDEEYYEAIFVIPPIVGGLFFEAEYYLFSNILYYLKKPKYVMFASVSTAILNIILNYFFIQKYGYIAAGYTTLLCYMLQSVIDYLISGKILGLNIFDKRKIFSISFVLLVFSLLINVFYKFALLRYFVIAILIIFACVFRKRIKNILLRIS